MHRYATRISPLLVALYEKHEVMLIDMLQNLELEKVEKEANDFPEFIE